MLSLAGAFVEVARQRGKGALQIGRAASSVVPGIADVSIGCVTVARVPGRIERERIAIAIHLAIERHPGIDAVVERTFDNIGKARFP